MAELPRERWGKDLLAIKPEVKRLWYKGNIGLLTDKRPKLAIVGTRRVTSYGVRVIEKWMPEIVAAGVTVVSGFMYGVDQVAHKACMDNKGKTIAVLGWGIDKKPSDSDTELYEKVLETDGLILSEFEGEMGGEKWTFPERNRIVVGLSDAVLVVEAALRSGSLITARLANKAGKPLMAVPGLVTSKVAEGTNEIIRSGKGKMVTTTQDVLMEMGLSAGQMKLGVGVVREPVISLLENADMSVDEIAKVLKISVPEVLGRLTKLTLQGSVCERNGKVGLL